jgi:hypothetical protein
LLTAVLLDCHFLLLPICERREPATEACRGNAACFRKSPLKATIFSSASPLTYSYLPTTYLPCTLQACPWLVRSGSGPIFSDHLACLTRPGRAELQTCVTREVNPVTRHAIAAAASVVSAAAAGFLNACHLQTDMGTDSNTHARTREGTEAAHFKIQILHFS